MSDVPNFMVRSLSAQLQLAQMEVAARTEEVRILRRAQDEVGAMATQLQQSNACIEQMKGHMDRVARTQGMKMDPYVGWHTLLDSLSATMRDEVARARADYDKHVEDMRTGSEYTTNMMSSRVASLENEVQQKNAEITELRSSLKAAQAEVTRLTAVCIEQTRHMHTMGPGAVDPYLCSSSMTLTETKKEATAPKLETTPDLNASARIEDLEKQLKDAEDQASQRFQSASDVYTEKLRLLTAQHEAAIATLESEKSALESKLEARNTYFENTLKALEQTLSAKRAEEREAAEAELNDALRQRDARDKELVAAREGHRQIRDMLSRSTHQLQLMSTANTDLTVKVKRLEAAAAEAEEYRRANEDLKSKAGQAELELMSIVERLRGPVTSPITSQAGRKAGKARK